uniref:Uncharacterized protein n=1 Tax=Plectus sambesii TaxID=2011161 RepID=A0A914WFY9_9BILA
MLFQDSNTAALIQSLPATPRSSSAQRRRGRSTDRVASGVHVVIVRVQRVASSAATFAAMRHFRRRAHSTMSCSFVMPRGRVFGRRSRSRTLRMRE